MTAEDYGVALAIWVGYVAVSTLCVWLLLRMTRGVAKVPRIALVSLMLAVLFAPSVVGGGHGGGIGPAWLALFQNFPIKLGVVPIAVTYMVLLAVGVLVFGRERKQE